MEIPRLYKYRYFNEELVSRNGLPGGEQIQKWKQVLYDGLVFPAAPATFNDPFDCAFLLEENFLNSSAARKMLADNLARRCPITEAEKCNLLHTNDVGKTLKSIFWKYFRVRDKYLCKRFMDDINEAVKGIRDALQVACFSETNRSILMWSHYANNHQGFCVEYDFSDWECKKYLKPVQYVSERQYVPGNFADNIYPGAENAFINAALYKFVEWSYEKEWRLVAPNIGHLNPKYKGCIPILNVGEFITAVYLGAKADRKFEQEICKHYQTKPVKIYRMMLEPESYSLKAEVIQQ